MKTLITENKKHIPGGLRFSNSASIEFVEYNQDGLDYVFDYIEHKNGMSVYFQNKLEFDKFPDYIEVASGCWYGEDGRWSPLEMRIGQLRFSNVSNYSTKPTSEIKNRIRLSKKIFSTKIKVSIQSSKLGNIVFQCDEVIPMPIIQTEVFNVREYIWQDRSESIDLFRKEVG